MTQYATIADLNAVGLSTAVTDGLGASAPAREALLNANLIKRSVFADGYLGGSGRYTLPLTAWGDDLRLAVCQLAAWDLMSVSRGFNPETPSGAMWMTRRDEAMRWLEGVAAGRVVPAGIVDSSPALTETGVAIYTEPQRGW